MTDSPQKERRSRHRPKSTHSNHPRAGKAGTAQTRSHIEVIERLLHEPVEVEMDGRPTKMPAVAAIMYLLVKKSLAGDKKAERARQKYEAHALQSRPSEFEIVFVDSDYTRAFATSRDGNDV